MLICQIYKRILKIHQSIFSIFRKLYHTPPLTATCHTHQLFPWPCEQTASRYGKYNIWNMSVYRLSKNMYPFLIK